MAEVRERANRRLAASRLLTPSALGLALICFLFGFLAVSCGTPGGYGRTGQGGETTYTGLDLATGTPPTVDPGHLRPELAGRTDDLGWHPMILLAAVAIAVGMVAGAGRFRLRRRVVVTATAAAIVLLVAGELVARQRLVDQVADQVRRPLPPGHAAADYVMVAGGFNGALVLTGSVLACFVVAYLRRRSAARTT
ncbi:MAG TPA: hypothetical protein VH969_24895 [Actinophytocola sp.]|jgi:hypothetical protein|uniref:hypothetical protein n=1 Tax=Actinophytocola sp. TaxID=1872138 RepID=UPI002F91DBEE